MIDHRVELPLTPPLELDDVRLLVLNQVVERIATPIKERGKGCSKGMLVRDACEWETGPEESPESAKYKEDYSAHPQFSPSAHPFPIFFIPQSPGTS